MKNLIIKLASFVISIIKNPIAYKFLKKHSERHGDKDKKIKVVFIVQMAEIWDKEIDVYKELKSRGNVEMVMLVVPEYDFAHKRLSNNYEGNYFLKNYPEAIRVLDSYGKTINLKEYEPDYVFFQRPYDIYLPVELRSERIIRFAKCCYIPYGYSCADVFNGGNTAPAFFRNMYFVFSESEYMQSLLKKKYKRTSENGYQHFEYLGYPNLESYLKMENIDKIKSIIWTPRWSYDKKIGGSQFFEYKDNFIAMKDNHPEIEFVFRPHPLMLQNFVREKRMTEEEVESFQKVLESKDIRFDKGTMLYETIDKADLMITDFSSIIINFFLTGKPLIYCESVITFNEDFNRFRDCIYIVHNQDELESTVDNLLNGNDYLKEKRLALIAKEFRDCIGAAKRIADTIMQDYYKS